MAAARAARCRRGAGAADRRPGRRQPEREQCGELAARHRRCRLERHRRAQQHADAATARRQPVRSRAHTNARPHAACDRKAGAAQRAQRNGGGADAAGADAARRPGSAWCAGARPLAAGCWTRRAGTRARPARARRAAAARRRAPPGAVSLPGHAAGRHARPGGLAAARPARRRAARTGRLAAGRHAADAVSGQRGGGRAGQPADQRIGAAAAPAAPGAGAGHPGRAPGDGGGAGDAQRCGRGRCAGAPAAAAPACQRGGAGAVRAAHRLVRCRQRPHRVGRHAAAARSAGHSRAQPGAGGTGRRAAALPAAAPRAFVQRYRAALDRPRAQARQAGSS